MRMHYGIFTPSFHAISLRVSKLTQTMKNSIHAEPIRIEADIIDEATALFKDNVVPAVEEQEQFGKVGVES
jgi:hypothetical protein